MAKRKSRPADLLSAPELIEEAELSGETPEKFLARLQDDAYDREMHPYDLLLEIRECREADSRMVVIDAKKLAEMQAGNGDPIIEEPVTY